MIERYWTLVTISLPFVPQRLGTKARENLNLTPIEGILQRLIAQSFRMHPAGLAIQQERSIAQHTATE